MIDIRQFNQNTEDNKNVLRRFDIYIVLVFVLVIGVILLYNSYYTNDIDSTTLTDQEPIKEVGVLSQKEKLDILEGLSTNLEKTISTPVEEKGLILKAVSETTTSDNTTEQTTDEALNILKTLNNR